MKCGKLSSKGSNRVIITTNQKDGPQGINQY
jgi:hypothetical protein